MIGIIFISLHHLFHLICLRFTFRLLLIFRFILGSISLLFNLLLILIRLMIFITSLHGDCIFLDKVINPFWVSSRSIVPICISMLGKLMSILQLLDVYSDLLFYLFVINPHCYNSFLFYDCDLKWLKL